MTISFEDIQEGIRKTEENEAIYMFEEAYYIRTEWIKARLYGKLSGIALGKEMKKSEFTK